jgi:two-component system cell cycle response regulator
VAPDQPRVVDYLRLDDERPFLHRAFDQALGDADRLRYAQLVEARDPARAEWLRLEVALHARATDDPAVLARFLELARQIGMEYVNLLLREVIMNCSSEAARHEPPRVRFGFACGKRWETLAPTDSAGVRMCQQCSEPVHYCHTIAEAETRAVAGQCIAIPKPLADGGGGEGERLGRPDPVRQWSERLFSLGPRREGDGPGEGLVVLWAKNQELVGHRYALEPAAGDITIGRGTDNTLVLTGDGTSRRHARLERRGDAWWVIDSGSTNGTHVNDEPVTEARLRDGDRIQIGNVILKFHVPRAAPSPIDPLTGLGNRRELIRQIDDPSRGAKRPLALALFDVDRFKRINDTYGHWAGDHVLRELARRMRSHVRAGESLARYAGDKFVLVLPGTDLAGAAARAEELRAAIVADELVFEEQPIAVTVSLGVAQATDDTRTAADLVPAAAEALRIARLHGR